ncbi:AfsR/SARP family transcriptional regulator [Streptomyces sp. TP-A0874]|uniref:AfsR/SARP family transcriptional regulator n=1 Tax=Streptomyces sp. TP-A0874 TaxID=549819 RepID=UPI000852AF29|nr:AfsR/SARP family transcriptional regulator [Streptomyces sp. TP-A0874]
MRFHLLGAFEIVTDDGRIHSLGAPKVCRVLALLLMRPGQVVSVNALVEEVWGEEAPRSAQSVLQTYVYQLRRTFERAVPAPAGRTLIETRPPGYRIQADAEDIDAKVFERLVGEGRTLIGQDRPDAASARLQRALDLWRGPVLANVAPGSVLTRYITHLEELRIRAIQLRVESGERLGHHREMIPELRALVTAYPLHEWFHARLIRALSRSGRRAEALHAYRELCSTLDRELGSEPGAELRRLEQELLGGRSARISPRGPAGRTGRSPQHRGDLS